MSAGLRLAAPLALLAGALLGCADPPPPSDAATDVELGVQKSADVPSAFSQHEIVSDTFFTDVDWIDAAGLHRFFANVPGTGRSWLADATVTGRDPAEIIVAEARAERLNPAILVIRMQVEASAVSPAERPSNAALSALMGCGCPDGAACDARFAGFRAQLACSAQTFGALFDASKNGTGEWRRGQTNRTLDGYAVTPRTHATAAHYAYTPWVLPGRGGNWLAWRVARDYVAAMRSVRGETAPACTSYADVPPGHPAYTAIEAGTAAGWWSGCADDRFCPGEGLSRAAAAAILVRVVQPRRVAPTGRFSDVPRTHWAAGAVESLAAAGIVSGCDAGRFCPDRLVARAELAALLARASGVAPVAPRGRYDDLPPEHWAAGVVEALPASALGTCAQAEFCPDAAASRGQTALAIARLFGLSPVDPCR